MATAQQYRHEDVATVPRGFRVRTVTAGGHKVRVAFPPGPRRKGAGKLVSILHPKAENPKKCNAKSKTEIEQQIKALESKKARPKELSVREEKKLAKLYMQRRGWNPGAPVPATAFRVELPKSKGWNKAHAQREAIKRHPDTDLHWAEKNKVTGNWDVWLTRRTSNPHNGAAQMYEDFHGRAPSEILTMQEALMTSGDYTALGDMGSLWLEPLKGEPSHWPDPDIEFVKSDKVKLATDSKGKQLYLVGGNQKLPLDYLEKHGVSTDKRFISLGEVYGISYLTTKSFDGFRDSEYAHEFGEQTGERPFAFYDAELKRIVLVGGAYSIAGVDDALGASPGIVN